MKYLLIGLLVLPVSLHAYETKVTRIVDGDTVVVNFENKQEKVRIIGINTPESVDPRRPVECFGKEASKKATRLLLNKEVILENYQERDRHGRLLAYIRLEDGTDFGETMISTGYAYSFKSYPHNRLSNYNRLEKEARSNSLGLWSPETCLTTDTTQDILKEERMTLIKQLIEIIKALLELFS